MPLLSLGIAFLVAFVLIQAFRRIGQSPIVACLCAGVLLRFIPELGDTGHAVTREDLQEFGILLLLFTAGLETDLELLRRDWKLVGITGLGQIVFNLAAAMGLGWVLANAGLLSLDSLNAVLVFGLCLSLSSTVAVLSLLKAHRATRARYGQAIVGLMVLQDLVAVVALSLLGLGEGGHSLGEWPLLSLAVGFVLLGGGMLLVGRKVLSQVLPGIEQDEGLLLIGAIGWCAAMAGLADSFGFPSSIAAFLAGVALSEMPQKHAILPRVDPLKVFGLTLYFIYLGFSLDVSDYTNSMLLPVAAGVALIVAGRPLLMRVLGRWGGLDTQGARRFGFTINQGSEFAMILAAAATAAGIFSPGTMLVIVLTSVLSLILGAWTHDAPSRSRAPAAETS